MQLEKYEKPAEKKAMSANATDSVASEEYPPQGFPPVLEPVQSSESRAAGENRRSNQSSNTVAAQLLNRNLVTGHDADLNRTELGAG